MKISVNTILSRQQSPRKQSFLCCILLWCLWISGNYAHIPPHPVLPPNIIIITVNHLNHTDLPVHDPKSIREMPNLKQMIRDGAVMNRFYTTGSSVQSNRISMLTGRLPLRHETGLIESHSGLITAGSSWSSEIFLPQILKNSSVPYASALISNAEFDLTTLDRDKGMGFDLKVLANSSGYGPNDAKAGTDDLDNRRRSTWESEDEQATRLTDETIRFIRTNTHTSTPWLVYMPLDIRHSEDCEISESGYLASKTIWSRPHHPNRKSRHTEAISRIDKTLGKIFNTLDSLDIAKNTFIFFTADGGWITGDKDLHSATPSNPEEEKKNLLREVNINVPAIALWKETIPPGLTVQAPLWTPDLFCLGTHLAGIDLPEDRLYDGKNPLEAMTGLTKTSPHFHLFFETGSQNALIWQDWKILRNHTSEPWQLYDLERDSPESQKRAGDHADLVKKLNEAFLQKKTEVHSYQVILENEEECECN